jgi:hypothetical protein
MGPEFECACELEFLDAKIRPMSKKKILETVPLRKKELNRSVPVHEKRQNPIQILPPKAQSRR